jgi:hypothetical protein
MAKRDRTLTVNVSVVAAIAALEARIEKLEADYAANEEKEAAFKKQHAAWQKKLLSFARKALAKALSDDASIHAWVRDSERGRASSMYAKLEATCPVAGDLPIEPVRDWNSMPEYQHRHIVEEINQSIRILRMTDDKTVPAATFASLSRYL